MNQPFWRRALAILQNRSTDVGGCRGVIKTKREMAWETIIKSPRGWAVAPNLRDYEQARAADHRVSDGHRGGLFLAAVDRLLQEPEKL